MGSGASRGETGTTAVQMHGSGLPSTSPLLRAAADPLSLRERQSPAEMAQSAAAWQADMEQRTEKRKEAEKARLTVLVEKLATALEQRNPAIIDGYITTCQGEAHSQSQHFITCAAKGATTKAAIAKAAVARGGGGGGGALPLETLEIHNKGYLGVLLYRSVGVQAWDMLGLFDDSGVQRQIPNHTIVTKLDDVEVRGRFDTMYIKVEVPGRDDLCGWISKTHVKTSETDDHAPPPPPSAPPLPPPAPPLPGSVNPGYQPQAPVEAAGAPVPHLSSQPSPPPPHDVLPSSGVRGSSSGDNVRYAWRKSGFVELREMPDGAVDPFFELENAHEVKVAGKPMEKGGEWWILVVWGSDGFSGWARQKDFRMSLNVVALTEVRVLEFALELSRDIGTIRSGAYVEALGVEDIWLHVKVDGVDGWARRTDFNWAHRSQNDPMWTT